MPSLVVPGGKESACNAGAALDVGSNPGPGRSPGGEHGHPLQYSCMSSGQGTYLGIKLLGHDVCVFQPCQVMPVPFRNTAVLIYTPEKAMAAHSSTLAWKIPWTEEPGGLQSMGL